MKGVPGEWLLGLGVESVEGHPVQAPTSLVSLAFRWGGWSWAMRFTRQFHEGILQGSSSVAPVWCLQEAPSPHAAARRG